MALLCLKNVRLSFLSAEDRPNHRLVVKTGMKEPPPKPPGRAETGQAASAARDKLIKEMIEKERVAVDAKTARLRALRLAKEASEPPPAKPARRRKSVP
jgi:hypothetical protein